MFLLSFKMFHKFHHVKQNLFFIKCHFKNGASFETIRLQRAVTFCSIFLIFLGIFLYLLKNEIFLFEK